MRNKNKILLIVVVFLLVSLMSTNVLAQERDSDLDGIPDSDDKYPFDYDNDGMPDIWEKKNGLRYDISNANEDQDNDGIKNIDEYRQGTNPLVSDKTGEKVAPELLTPVERTMARGLIWVGVALFLFMISIFVLYRAHISRIFRFMHHVSKEHFKRREMGRYMAPIIYRKRYLPPRRFGVYPKARFVQRPIIREVPKPIREPIKTRITQEESKKLKEGKSEEELKAFERIGKVVYTKPKEQQRAYPRKEESLGRLVGERKDEDVFGRLSKYIHSMN